MTERTRLPSPAVPAGATQQCAQSLPWIPSGGLNTVQHLAPNPDGAPGAGEGSLPAQQQGGSVALAVVQEKLRAQLIAVVGTALLAAILHGAWPHEGGRAREEGCSAPAFLGKANSR